MSEKYFAAIDLGTNSCRLVIADENRNYVYKDTHPVRLGEGMYQNMCFTPEAMQRGLEALAEFKKRLMLIIVVKFGQLLRPLAEWPAMEWLLSRMLKNIVA